MYQVLYKSCDNASGFWKIWATVLYKPMAEEIARRTAEDLGVQTVVVEIPYT